MNIPKDFPYTFLQKLRTFCTQEQYEQILLSMKNKRNTTLRINTLKVNSKDCIEQGRKEHVLFTPHSFYDKAFILESPTLRQFTETELYKNGCVYVQSFSSMIPPIVLNPKPDETVIDIAAAPGSKTTQMAMMMNNTGIIIANDSSQIRLYKLQANIKQQGVTNAKIRKGMGQTIWQEYFEMADKVLVDVPCSMEGRFQFTEPESYEFWSPKKIKELVQIQRFLLKSAVSACKPDGTIVYSTCTLSPEENEGVVDWILGRLGSVITIEDISIKHVPMIPGLLSYKEKSFHPDLHKTCRILPDSYFEGFYIAKFKKTASLKKYISD